MKATIPPIGYLTDGDPLGYGQYIDQGVYHSRSTASEVLPNFINILVGVSLFALFSDELEVFRP